MNAIVNLRRADQQAFPHYWPTVGPAAALSRMLQNVPVAKGKQRYEFVVRPIIGDSPASVIVQPNGSISFNQMDKKQQSDALAAWVADHQPQLKARSRDGMVMTIVGSLQMLPDAPGVFVAYYVVQDGLCYLDHGSVRAACGLRADEYGDRLQCFTEDSRINYELDPRSGTFKSLDAELIRSSTPLLMLPVSRSEPRGEDEPPRLLASPAHMRFMAFRRVP